MTDTTHEPIIRMVPRVEFLAVLERHHHYEPLDMIDDLTVDLTVRSVRELAAAYRTTHPEIAADLVALCDRIEAGPIWDWDQPAPTGEHEAVLWHWVQRLWEEAPLLEALASDLNGLRAAKAPGVIHARRALALLPAAEHALPGADAALRPLLMIYAAEEAR